MQTSSVASGAVATFRQDERGYTDDYFATLAATLPFTADDWLQLRVNFISPACDATLANSRSWLAIEVAETVDAADPPADISGYTAGQPAAGEVILRVPATRRTRFKADLAGSHGVAGTAPTAQTDFDIQRNGASFATMRFAAGATSGTFIAASETVLEPGQVLSVIAPSTPDATLAGIGFTLAGALVL